MVEALRPLALEHLQRAQMRAYLIGDVEGWTLQGLGMLRRYLDVNCTFRLHVWHNDYAVPGVSTIHTHPWDLESLVLSGYLRNQRFHEAAPLPGLRTFKRQTLRCGQGGGLVGKPETVRLITGDSEVLRQGQTYTQRADEVHASRPDSGCVTLVKRDFKADTEHAYVYYAAEDGWVSAEPRAATREEVCEILGYALERWSDT